LFLRILHVILLLINKYLPIYPVLSEKKNNGRQSNETCMRPHQRHRFCEDKEILGGKWELDPAKTRFTSPLPTKQLIYNSNRPKWKLKKKTEAASHMTRFFPSPSIRAPVTGTNAAGGRAS